MAKTPKTPAELARRFAARRGSGGSEDGGVVLGLADGPTEAHKVNLARLILKNYDAEDPEWPSEFLDIRVEAAHVKYAGVIDRVPALP